MISGRQIRAARGLLGWDATDLADKANMTRESIYRIESDTVQPQERTIAKIIRVFDLHGVEFTDDEGVRVRKNQVRVFSGKEGYKQFLDHIYETVKDGNSVIRQFNLSDKNNLSYADDYACIHVERMGKIRDLDAKVLTIEGDYNFPALYCKYRWLDKSSKILIPYYVYGNFVSQSILKSANNIEIVSIYSKLLAERYKEQFDLFWDTAKIPPSKEGAE
jgi:DNA-binding XRE family transcriptional regulator